MNQTKTVLAKHFHFFNWAKAPFSQLKNPATKADGNEFQTISEFNRTGFSLLQGRIFPQFCTAFQAVFVLYLFPQVALR